MTSAAVAADSGWAGLSRLELIQQGFAALHPACWSCSHVLGRRGERKPSAVSLQRGMGEVRRTEKEREGESWGGVSSAHPGSDS